MNRPVGASSTAVTISANERLGKGSLRSGPTSVMFRPGMLGNVAVGSPAPTGGAAGAVPGTAPGRTGRPGAGTSRGGTASGAGLKRLPDPNPAAPPGPGPGSSLGTWPTPVPGAGSGSGAGTSSTPEPGSCIRARVTPSFMRGIIRSPYGLSLGRSLTILI